MPDIEISYVPEPEIRLFIHPETMRKAAQLARRRSQQVGEYIAESLRNAVRDDYNADKDRQL